MKWPEDSIQYINFETLVLVFYSAVFTHIKIKNVIRHLLV